MNNTNRLYSCKTEELLPISKFTLFSFKRDIADFSAFSNQFGEQYVTEAEALITLVENLLEPEAETLALKLIKQNMDQNFLEIQRILLTIEGYLKLSQKETGITSTAFGLSNLRKCNNKKDPEGVLKGIKVVMANLQNHQSKLEQKGMPATTLTTLQALYNSLDENKLKQFEIKTGRAAIVENNVKSLNDLYLRMSEIFTIGKILYKNSDPIKYNDYTFAKLIKKVRNTRSPMSDVQSPMSEVNTL